MTDRINRPPHYTHSSVEPIDVIEAWRLGFHLGNVVKYVARAGKKAGAEYVEDLRKARWYLEREIERAVQEEAARLEGILERAEKATRIARLARDLDGGDRDHERTIAEFRAAGKPVY